MKPTTKSLPAATVRFGEGGLLGEYPFTTAPNLLQLVWDDLEEFDYDFTELFITLPNGRVGTISSMEMHACFVKGRITEAYLAKRMFAAERKEASL